MRSTQTQGKISGRSLIDGARRVCMYASEPIAWRWPSLSPPGAQTESATSFRKLKT